MCLPPDNRNALAQLALAAAMLEKSRRPRNALADFLDTPQQPSTSALANYLGTLTMPTRANSAGMFGNPYPSNLGFPNAGGRGIGAYAKKSRNVFYSFHFEDVRRVNQIRLCDQFRDADRDTPRVRDRSLWETSKKLNPAALTSMIDKGLDGTSVTCVLAGFGTWEREWVRYEIARSLVRGNGLLTVSIHNCPCPTNGRSLPGYNPLDFIALWNDLHIYEWDASGEWKRFGRIRDKLTSWPKWLRQPRFGEAGVKLSESALSYDWVNDSGTRNLIHWTDAAAEAAGK
jgi:hypothetical protein